MWQQLNTTAHAHSSPDVAATKDKVRICAQAHGLYLAGIVTVAAFESEADCELVV